MVPSFEQKGGSEEFAPQVIAELRTATRSTVTKRDLALGEASIPVYYLEPNNQHGRPPIRVVTTTNEAIISAGDRSVQPWVNELGVAIVAEEDGAKAGQIHWRVVAIDPVQDKISRPYLCEHNPFREIWLVGSNGRLGSYGHAQVAKYPGVLDMLEPGAMVVMAIPTEIIGQPRGVALIRQTDLTPPLIGELVNLVCRGRG